MKTIYLGLGSNIGDRASNLRAATGELAAGGVRILRASPIYETEPVDYTQQRWFLNQVVEAETELFPMQLLSRIGQIERGLGRVRTVAKGPRTIDIDILFYGQAKIHSATLEIPHPRMAQRRLVLAPLADLALYTAIIEEKAREATVQVSGLKRLAAASDDRAFFAALGELILRRYERDPELSRLLLFSCLERHELAELFFERLFQGAYRLVMDYIRRRIRE